MTQILNHTDIEHKIRRIAYQIYETHLNEEEIVLAGINGNGYVFAQFRTYAHLWGKTLLGSPLKTTYYRCIN